MARSCMKWLLMVAVVVVTGIPAFSIRAEEHRPQRAHEHGIAHLNVAVEGNKLIIEFSSPAANVVGFEHRPRTQEQKDAVKEAVRKLDAAEMLLHLPPAAHAGLARSVVHTDIGGDSGGESDAAHKREPADGHGKEEDPGGDHHEEKEHAHENHSDFKAEYQFLCRHPEKLAYLEILFFRVFPAIERIKVQVLTGTKQSARELTAKDNRILF
jgi:hypothetical protein